jgi:hypothetical protein
MRIAATALSAAVFLAGAAALAAGPETSEEYAGLLSKPDVMRQGGHSALVSLDAEGRLVYGRDADGNRICDFSYAGYRGGGVPIPDVPVVLELEPGQPDGDDTRRIQDAVDRLGSMPVQPGGFRGALLLRRGRFTVSDTIRIRHSGIVIRGEGAGFGGTWIYHRRMDPIEDETPGTYIHYPQPAKGMIPTLLTHGGKVQTRKVSDVLDPLVPAGTPLLHLDGVAELAPGDEAIVISRQTPAWIDALGLADVWKPEEFVLRFPRIVEEVRPDENAIVLNVPVTSRIDQAAGHARAEVHRVTDDARLTNVGLEDILFLSGYDRSIRGEGDYFTDEHHPNYVFRFYNTRDGWVRRCVAFFYSCGLVSTGGSRHLTVEDCAMLDGVSADTPVRHVGSRKYYFNAQGEMLLFQRCYSRYARHAFVGNGPCGGAVILDCFSENDHLPSEWHQRWGHGHLFDNLCTEAPLSIVGVGNYPHGQRAAFALLWNCLANNKRPWEQDLRVNDIPGLCRNYAIGNVHRGSERSGLYEAENSLGVAGTIESPNRFVRPRSLYLAQLRERLGEGAVLSVATRKQLSGLNGPVWLELIARFSGLPEYEDPDEAPWPGFADWVPTFEMPPAGH